MSKELEALEKLLSFAFVMSENMVGLTKGNYDEKQFINKTYSYLHTYNVDFHSELELKHALQRLEGIEGANQNEALKCLKNNSELFDKIALENPTTYKDETFTEAYLFKTNTIKIEQGLLKAQEKSDKEIAFDLINTKNVDIKLLKWAYPSVEAYNVKVRTEKDYWWREELTNEEFEFLGRMVGAK